nr:ATP-binding cassette domain-containing protein [Neisseriaceae bacterium]
MSILIVENAALASGHLPLLDNTHFTLNPGETVGLIGRNGAGKSSFLKVLAGVNKLDDGKISMNSGLKIAYVAQEPVLNPEHTVFEAVAEGLGELTQLLTQYHQVSHLIAEDPSEANFDLLQTLQNGLEAQDGWQIDALIQTTMTHLDLPED